MKPILFFFIAVLCLFFTGCCTVYETSPVAVDESCSFDLRLRLDGFELLTLQQTGMYTGITQANAYNYQSGAYASGSNSTVGAVYEMRQDQDFSYSTVDVFERLGFNIKSNNPQLVLVGRIGRGRFDFGSPWFYLRDAPLFLIAIPTFGATIGCTRQNDAHVLVYNIEGKRIASYKSTQSYSAVSIAFPFANVANPKAYESYGDQQAACFALADCINQFTADLKKGRFNSQIISK